ncbi:Uncharacterised protein [Bacillus freudenreichii]|nr:Uncharacterised protein [Bacillus freudenreichii]
MRLCDELNKTSSKRLWRRSTFASLQACDLEGLGAGAGQEEKRRAAVSDVLEKADAFPSYDVTLPKFFLSCRFTCTRWTKKIIIFYSKFTFFTLKKVRGRFLSLFVMKK